MTAGRTGRAEVGILGFGSACEIYHAHVQPAYDWCYVLMRVHGGEKCIGWMDDHEWWGVTTQGVRVVGVDYWRYATEDDMRVLHSVHEKLLPTPAPARPQDEPTYTPDEVRAIMCRMCRNNERSTWSNDTQAWWHVHEGQSVQCGATRWREQRIKEDGQ